jgi:hypothetical protein
MRWPGISMRRLSPIGSGMFGSLRARGAKVHHTTHRPLTAAAHCRYTDDNRQYTDELQAAIT